MQGNPGGKKYSENELTDLQMTREWRQNYSKYLRKVIRDGRTIRNNLGVWLNQFKRGVEKCVTCSMPQGEGVSLFTKETWTAVESVKRSCEHLQDPLGMDKMCTEVKANPNSETQVIGVAIQKGRVRLRSVPQCAGSFCQLRNEAFAGGQPKPYWYGQTQWHHQAQDEASQ